MFSIKKNKTTSTLWHVLIPMSGVTLLASATGGMSGDLFNLLVTQELGYTPSVLSLVYIGMLFSFPIQLLGPGIARRFTFRKLMLFGNFVSGLSIIAIVLAAQLNISSEIRVVIIVSSAIIVEIAYSLSYGTVWFTWVGDVVDRNDRSLVMAFGKVLSQGSLAVCFLIQTTLFDGAVTRTFYLMVSGWLLLYLLGSSIVYLVLPENDSVFLVQKNDRRSLSNLFLEVKQDIQLILLNPLYRLILSSSAGQLLIGVPIVSVYLVEIVKSPSEIVGYALIARTITSMLIMFIIGSLIRKIGIVRVIRISGIGSTVALVPWILIPPKSVVSENPWVWLPVIFVPLLFAFKSIFSTSIANASYDLIPRKDQVTVFTFCDVVSSAALQLSGVIGAWIVSLSSGDYIVIIFDKIGFTLVSLWVITGIVISVILTRNLSREASSITILKGEADGI